jgi:hypothetical protein
MLHGLPATLDRLGLKQCDLARGIHRREETVSRWMHGKKLPSGEVRPVVPSGDSVTAVLAFLRTHDPKVTYEEISGLPGEQLPLPIRERRGVAA